MTTKAVTPDELKRYRYMLGKLLFLGRLTQQVILRIASEMAVKTNHPLVHHLRNLKSPINYTLKIASGVKFKSCHGNKKIQSLSIQ